MVHSKKKKKKKKKRLRPTKNCRDEARGRPANRTLSSKQRNKLAHTINGNGPKIEERERLDRDNTRVDRGETRKKPAERRLKKQQEDQEEERKELLSKHELLEAQQKKLDEQHRQQQLDLFQEKLQLEQDLEDHKNQQVEKQQLLEQQHQQQQLELHQTKHQMQQELENQQQQQHEKQQQQQQQLDHQVQQQQEIQQQQQQQLDHQVQQQHLNHQQSQELFNQQQQELLKFKADLQQKQEIILNQQQQLEQQHSKEKDIERESLRRRRCQLEEDHRQQQLEQSRIQQELQLQQTSLEEKQHLLQQQFNVELEKGKLELLDLQQQLEKKNQEGLKEQEVALQLKQRLLIEQHNKEKEDGKQELLVLQQQLSEQRLHDQQQQQQRSEELKKQEEDLELQRLQLQRQQEDEMEKGRYELQSLRDMLGMEFEEQKTSLKIQGDNLRHQQQQLQQQQQIFQEKEERLDQYYVHQPYATDTNSHYQLPQDPRFDELQRELRQERAEKGELRELLKSLQHQLKEMTQELNLQRMEAQEQREAAKKESLGMQARYLQELQAERAQVKELNHLRADEDDVAMAVVQREVASDENLHLNMMRELEGDRKKSSKVITEAQLSEREGLRTQMTKEEGKLALVQGKFENDALKEEALVTRLELVPEYWPDNMVLSEASYKAGGRGVYLTTTKEVRRRMAGAELGAWESLTLVTLFPPTDKAKEVQVVLKVKTDDGVKRSLRRLWLSALGREVLPKGTDISATVRTRELVARLDKRWAEEKRWLEVKRSPMKLSQELKKLPGYVDTYNARVGDQQITVMLRVKETEVKNFLRESGKEGTFTKERDHLDEKAVKASVLWLPKDDTLSLARDKAEEVEGGLGLVLNEYGLGIRVNSWHEKAAREMLHLPAKLPETRISGIPIGTSTDEAVKYLISREGWEVRKMKDGVRNGMRWMVVRGPERDGETVTIDGVLCLLEPMKKKVVAPVKSVKVAPKVKEQKPEKRRDPSEGTDKWYTRVEFIAYHGKKKGIRLWGKASQNAQEASVKLESVSTPEQQKQNKKEKNTPPKNDERKKCSVEDRLERLERLLLSLVGSK